MNRDTMFARAVDRREPWDIIVIGGGATGTGIALDAATRGHTVLLLERGDFAGEASSASTKLIHGGVRYLRQGNLRLVRESITERARLLRNAPDHVRPLPFLVPAYRWWEKPYYATGLIAYDRLAGRSGIGRTRVLGTDATLEQVPTLRTEGLRGGVLYHDAQFEDARLALAIVAEAAAHGAVLLNYCEVHSLLISGASGTIRGVVAVDHETGHEFEARAKVVISAAGVGTDAVRRFADPDSPPMIRGSRGSHIVLDGGFLPGGAALMVPETPDGRLIFAIPWEGVTVVGTTDVATGDEVHAERATREEVDYLLALVSRYLTRAPLRSDIRAVFAGVRPLVAKPGSIRTSKLARDHVVRTEDSGLVVIAGGKWTTYRVMARDAVDRAERVGGLERRACHTAELTIDARHPLSRVSTAGPSRVPHEGRDPDRATLHSPRERVLHHALPYTEADVIRAVRHEMARTVGDVLARRTRALYLDADAATSCVPAVARILARELGRNDRWIDSELANFRQTVLPNFLPPG